ncbi:MAG: hypothetical protein PVJ63_10115 [Thioalkalispiraceae bacterium]|jgi:hypothetical protein
MYYQNLPGTRLLLLVPFVLLLAACTAGDTQFSEQTPAGFWYGLWHGVISVIALIVHVFNDSILVYETHNSGGWYDFGFLLGVIIIWGGGCHVKCKTEAQKKRAQEWEAAGEKVGKKIKHKLKEWAEEDDWEEISDMVEKKIKRKIREWAEKD